MSSQPYPAGVLLGNDHRTAAARRRAYQDYRQLHRRGEPRVVRELVCARILDRLERQLEVLGVAV